MAGNKLYVGNLDYSVTDADLKELFSAHGEVVEAVVIPNKGFGFVTMADADQAKKAQESLNNSDLKGRALKIDEARPPKEKGHGGGRGGFGGNRGGGRGRY